MTKTIHIFGKEGCRKCDMLKRRVDTLLTQEQYASRFSIVYHDCKTEDGIAAFCLAGCISPNCIPALVVAGENGEYEHRQSQDYNDKAVLPTLRGICTDYSEDGHKGVITPEMIEGVLDES